ncbi:hypothetical protein ACJJH9_03845 [Microbulbifer sp. DLAB2-AF]|uniref:hypothetical protein n=1 Tax=unclassified Microbulbifer TaxID=2619833 RepID=UPI0024AE03CF|nr:hypothetical protein [Microbulbifer sp. VAAF005]WHI48421.1 hypothetical protein P0078_08630 [Microbulbifer sp. VAAF005]
MSKNERKKPLTPEELRKRAKKILQDNPTYINDEPSVVGSPETLTEEIEDDDEPTNDKK